MGLALGVLVLGGVLATATVREIGEGSRAIAESDAAIERGDTARAITQARAAAQAVVPGSPYPARGYERLETLARDAEARGDDATANTAWQAMRAAALSTRGLAVKTEGWLALASESLARLSAQKNAATTTDAPRADRGEAMLEALHRTEPPPTLTFVLLAAGGAGFLGGVARLAWAAGDRLSWRVARVPALVALAGAAVYAAVCARG